MTYLSEHLSAGFMQPGPGHDVQNVLLGYRSLDVLGDACDLVTDQCFQEINVSKDDPLIESDHYFETLTHSIQP